MLQLCDATVHHHNRLLDDDDDDDKHSISLINKSRYVKIKEHVPFSHLRHNHYHDTHHFSSLVSLLSEADDDDLICR